MMKSKILIGIVMVCMIAHPLIGQNKVLGIPEKYIRPEDFSIDPVKFASFLEETHNKHRTDAWLVISDRDNNQVFDRPGGTPTRKINFKEYFYVTDEHTGWIQIYKGTVDGLKVLKGEVYGWVPKENMLLWNSGLIDYNTKIHKKGFLLNKAKEIREIIQLPQDQIEFAKVYKSPDKSVELEQIPIHDFYFIMKYNPKNATVLLCKNERVSPVTVNDIIGWVSLSRMTPWNTRICLEPNFEEIAFKERKLNPAFQVRGFEDLSAANDYASGAFHQNKIFWKEDPVLIDKIYLAKTNPNRFVGSVVRFPMFTLLKSKTGTSEVYRSGVIGKVILNDKTKPTLEGSNLEELEYAQIVQRINQFKQSIQDLNVYFVIEATRATESSKLQIEETVREIASDLQDFPNAKFGALLYRDVMDVSPVESIPLTSDFSKVSSFLSNASYVSKDFDNYTCLYHGINKSLTEAGFSKNSRNVIILIGGNGDYYADIDRRTVAQNKGEATFYNDAKRISIFESLSALKAQIFAVQLMRDESRPSRAFGYNAQLLILESAKYAYNKLENDPDTKVLQSHSKLLLAEPEIPVPTPEVNFLSLEGGRVLGSVTMPSMDKRLTAKEVTSKLIGEIERSTLFEQGLILILEKVYVEGKPLKAAMESSELKDFNVSAGQFSDALYYVLNEFIGQMSPEEIGQSLENAKYKLYTEVYFPVKVHGAMKPSFSHVLFMPESDLLDYMNKMNRLVSDQPNSYDEKREKLFSIHKDIVETLAGEKIFTEDNEIKRSDLFALLQGVKDEGLEIPVELDIRLVDIMDERKVSNEVIDQLYERYGKVYSFFSKIKRDLEGYEFKYTSSSGNRYYWIPVSDAF